MRKIIKDDGEKGKFKRFIIGHTQEEKTEPEDLGPTPEELLQEALGQCEVIKKEAEDRAKAVCDDACRQGYEEGRQKGYDEVKEELSGLIKSFGHIEEELRKQKIESMQNSETELVELSLKIAEKMVRYELDHNKKFVLNAITASLPYLADKDEIIIRVNPVELKIVQESLDQIRKADATIVKMEVVQDEQVFKGGAVVQSPSGSV